MSKRYKRYYHRKPQREDNAPKEQLESDYHYPLEKPIIDIYREINADLWRETFGEEIFHFR